MALRNIKMAEIIPGKLFQRGNLLKYTPEEKAAAMSARGITTVVNLYAQVDPDLPGIVDEYIHMPIADGKVYEPEKILEMSRKLTADIQMRNRVVLVHCYGGKNRSGLMNALICINVLHMRTDPAITYIRNLRKGALFNQHFVDFLHELE